MIRPIEHPSKILRYANDPAVDGVDLFHCLLVGDPILDIAGNDLGQIKGLAISLLRPADKMGQSAGGRCSAFCRDDAIRVVILLY